MKEVNNLGQLIESKWAEKNYNEEVFPKLAKDALLESGDLLSIEPWSIAEWAIGENTLPEQRDIPGKFGDPPITLFNAPRFHIDAYFWLDGTTSIHQHGFCGAFQVLSGSSIHSEYDFETTNKHNVFLKSGKLSLRSCELLEKGAVQEIIAGEEYIHSLFHLDQPSVTIVVRTHKSPLHLPQFSYWKPGLAIDPFFEETEVTKRSQILIAELIAGFEGFEGHLEMALKKSDLLGAFKMLDGLRKQFAQPSVRSMFGMNEDGRVTFDQALEMFSSRFPGESDLIRNVFGETGRLESLVALRRLNSNSDHRFFFALLMNLESQSQVFDLVGKRFPDQQPIELCLDWVSDLANTRILDGSAPNGLGIEGFTDQDVLVLEALLKDQDQKEIGRLLNPTGDEGVSSSIEVSIKRIRTSGIFQSLLKA